MYEKINFVHINFFNLLKHPANRGGEQSNKSEIIKIGLAVLECKCKKLQMLVYLK